MYCFAIGLKCKKRAAGQECNCLKDLKGFEESRKSTLETYNMDIADYCTITLVVLQRADGSDFNKEMLAAPPYRNYDVEHYELRFLPGLAPGEMAQEQVRVSEEHLARIRNLAGIVQDGAKTLVKSITGLDESEWNSDEAQFMRDLFYSTYSIANKFLLKGGNK